MWGNGSESVDKQKPPGEKESIAENRSWFNVVFHSPKITIVKYWVLLISCEVWICTSVPVQPDDPLWVSRWPSVSYHPPPHIEASPFYRQILSTLSLCHMDLWLAWLVLTHHHRHCHQQLPSSRSPRGRLVTLLISGEVFSSGLPFALFWSSLELLSSSPLE